MLYNWRRKWQLTPAFLPEKSHGGAWQATVPGVATIRHNLETNDNMMKLALAQTHLR